MAKQLRRRSLIIWLVLAESAAAVLIAAGFIVLLGRNQLDLMAENIQLKSGQMALEIRERVEKLLPGPAVDERALADYEHYMKARGLSSLRLSTGEGRLLYPASEGGLDPSEWRLAIQALGSRDFEHKLYLPVASPDSRQVILFVPCSLNGIEGAVLRLAFAFPELDRDMELLSRQALTFGLLVLLVHGLVGLMAWRRIVRPLHQLATAVDLLGQGQYNPPLPTKKPDEIGHLTQAFEQMSLAVRDMQDKARAANPLSGLPGNVEIEHHIRDRLEGRGDFAVLYCDLDHFKAYNDVYGFQKGDEVILHSRDCLLATAQALSLEHCFIGHEGGDDFIMVCSLDDWEKAVRELLSRFDAGVPGFYLPEHRQAGFIETVDRQGRPARFPLLSMSVGVVRVQGGQPANFGEISRLAAELKKFAKSQTGSTWALDRRNS